MKYLKYILALVAALVIGFLLLGVFKPKLAYVDEITVEKSVNETWAVIQDEEKLSDWLPGFQKIEHISGTPGTVGAVSNVYFDTDGQEMTIRETITDIVPNKSISMLYESDFMDMTYMMEITAVDGKARISSSTVTEGNGMISKSMMVLFAGSIKSQEETNLANLKKTIEANTKRYLKQ